MSSEDLFGNPIDTSKHVLIFADERKNVSNQWHYLGLVVIRAEKANYVLNILARHKTEHGVCDSELKFAALNKKGKGAKLNCAQAWLKELLYDHRSLFYFSVIGIDKNKLDFSYFGEGKEERGKYGNVYNRFFRTAVIGALKYFIGDGYPIVIDGIFHDSEGNLENHPYFSWHLPFVVSREESITCTTDRIYLINSNQSKEREFPRYCDLIQLTDLIVGSVSYCFDISNPHNLGQKKLSLLMLPLVQDIIESPWEDRAFAHVNKYSISFFPSRPITIDKYSGYEIKGQFYYNREIKLQNPSKIIKQIHLPI